MKKLFCILLLSSFSNIALCDKVLRVYSCGNDVGIQFQNAGWVVALESQIGVKRVDRILSLGLVLYTSGRESGYFDMAAPINWCGITNVRPITVLEILPSSN
jgi:hypothetical protein